MEKSHWFCCLKNQQTIGLLSKLRHLVSTHTLINIYNSLIARYLRYGLVAWGQASKNELDKLLILQKRALRYIFFANRRDHAIPLFLKAEILPIHCLHYKLLAETMHDISNDLKQKDIHTILDHQLQRISLSKSQGLRSNEIHSPELVRDCGMSYQQSFGCNQK